MITLESISTVASSAMNLNGKFCYRDVVLSGLLKTATVEDGDILFDLMCQVAQNNGWIINTTIGAHPIQHYVWKIKE